MKQYPANITISAIAIVLVAIHLVWPLLKFDAATLTLLGLAALPWLGTVFKSIELPGVAKIEYRELEEAEQNASDVGLLKSSGAEAREKELPTYLAVAEDDPNLALAGLRIEIERKLNTIAQACGIHNERKSASQLLRSLAENGVLSEEQHSVLNDLLGLLKLAVHGARVDSRSAKWAFETGPRVLAALDDLASSSKNTRDP